MEWKGGHRKGEQEHKLQELMSLRRRCRGRKSRGADFGLCGETVRSEKNQRKRAQKIQIFPCTGTDFNRI